MKPAWHIARHVTFLKSNLLPVVIERMDTKKLDLGLLVTLEALLAEGNVTRAARRLNLSQPALSARLARLRDALGDPLLIPAQRGMVLTQRAVELQQPLHEALEGVRRVVADGAPFDPATMQATLVIAASDYQQYALLTRFSVALRTEAPMVRIAWRTLDVLALAAQLERGEVDLALATPNHAPAAMRQRQLYRENYTVIARQGHPAVQDHLSLDVFCALEHVVVSLQGGGFSGATDAALEAVGRRRTVALSTPGFLIVPEVVSQSDMIALVPRRLADGWADRLQVLEPPLAIPGVTVASVWHDRTTNHPAQRWLRERLTTLAAEG
ncbi:LysR family transcriptional regulator [Aurantimonas sp. MSK8Z-1]|uniref:LysR family transcriptional regulator n=1 Tax=Mangrovibrevibacter kandeliae TaxID=2968473 RepID=UPI002118E8F9|nr:LysR family transcriptional regulator [Aurantimonas sp. MSK8Z-1]MCW4116521.1 LysR family transcriptional regulator [Aurantimonas sp. MSK8Z-1]